MPPKEHTFSHMVDLLEHANPSDLLPSSPETDGDSSSMRSGTESEQETDDEAVVYAGQPLVYPYDPIPEDNRDPEQAIGEIAEIAVLVIEIVSRVEARLSRLDANGAGFTDNDNGSRVDWGAIRQSSSLLMKSIRCSMCKRVDAVCDREEPCQSCSSEGLIVCEFGQDVVDEARGHLARLLIALQYAINNLNDSTLEHELRVQLSKLSLSAGAPKKMGRKFARPAQQKHRRISTGATTNTATRFATVSHPNQNPNTEIQQHQPKQSDWRVMRTIHGFRMEADRVYSLRDFIKVLSKQFPRKELIEAVREPPTKIRAVPELGANEDDDIDSQSLTILQPLKHTDVSINEVDEGGRPILSKDHGRLPLTAAFLDETEDYAVDFHFDRPCCFHLPFREPCILYSKKEFHELHGSRKTRSPFSSFLYSCIVTATLKRAVRCHRPPNSLVWSDDDINRVGQWFLDGARSSLDDLWDEPHLFTMQGLVYLSVSVYNNHRASNIYLALGIRMGYEMGMHKGEIGKWGKNEVRITMTALYILDFYNVLLLGKPSLMKEIQLRLPSPTWAALERAARSPDDAYLRMFLMASTRLTQVQKFIITSLYLTPLSASRYPTELVDMFDNQLDEIYRDLPDCLKYDTNTMLNPSPAQLHVTLSIAGLYHLTRIILHQRLCLPNTGPSNTVPFDPPTFTVDLSEDSSWHDSLIMCRDAAESLTQLLEIVVDRKLCFFQSMNYFLAANVFIKLAKHPDQTIANNAKSMALRTLSLVKQTKEYLNTMNRLSDWVKRSENEMKWFM